MSDSVLIPAYTCQVCRRTLTLSGPPIIGESREAQLGRVSKMLAEHFGNEHKEQMMQTQIHGMNFAGWLLWSRFQHNNAELEKESEKIRLSIRQFSKRVHVPDESLESQINTHLKPETMTPGEIRSTVIRLLKGLRNVLEEAAPPA